LVCQNSLSVSFSMTRLKHIAVCGNIGSGKTSLTEKLAKHYGWNPLYESVDNNPYLRDFYQDMSKWAFHVQIFFLNSRFRQVNEIHGNPKPTIQDRTIYEDAYIFAANLHQSGHMTDRDYRNYMEIFQSMITFVKPPDLLIYLKASVPKLVRQIEKRGRDFEYSIRLDYLRQLNKQYEAWISNYRDGKLLTIDVDRLDFVENIDDFSSIVTKVDYELNNLFE
jgi:deoxyadenosine/deoxycytidine kinase